MKKANIDELKVSVARPGVTRKSFSGEGATLAWGSLTPGHEPRPHTHPHEQIVYIVSGHGTFTVGEETTEVGQGDMLVVPSGVRAAAHYPPVGERSLSLSTRAARFGAVPASNHIPASLAQTVLVGQIESREGLDALAPILDARVFDALFFGPADLSVSLREPGRGVVHPDVASLLGEATDVITGSGTPLGIFCANAAEARQWAERGLTFLVIATDLGMLRGAAQSVLGQLRTRS